MEKLKLTAKELQDRLNWKKSKVYYWINTKKFETVDAELGLKILITEAKLEELKNDNSSEQFEVEFEKVEENSKPVQNSSKISDNEVILAMLSMLKDQLNNNNNQINLLETSEKSTKDTYYEVKAKYEHLQEIYKQLQTEHSELIKKFEALQKVLEKERKKPFWKRNIM